MKTLLVLATDHIGPQLKGLSDALQVVSYDPRGYGKSQPPVRDFPLGFYQREADDCAALMAALGHERYGVMGWSDGAIAAVKLAASQPEAVVKLCIFGGNSYFTQEDIDAFESLLRSRYEYKKLANLGLGPQDSKSGVFLNRVVHILEGSRPGR